MKESLCFIIAFILTAAVVIMPSCNSLVDESSAGGQTTAESLVESKAQSVPASKEPLSAEESEPASEEKSEEAKAPVEQKTELVLKLGIVSGDGEIRHYDSSTTIGNICPRSFGIDSDGSIWLVDSGNARVCHYADGKQIDSIPIEAKYPADYEHMVVDSKNIYLAGSENNYCKLIVISEETKEAETIEFGDGENKRYVIFMRFAYGKVTILTECVYEFKAEYFAYKDGAVEETDAIFVSEVVNNTMTKTVMFDGASITIPNVHSGSYPYPMYMLSKADNIWYYSEYGWYDNLNDNGFGIYAFDEKGNCIGCAVMPQTNEYYGAATNEFFISDDGGIYYMRNQKTVTEIYRITLGDPSLYKFGLSDKPIGAPGSLMRESGLAGTRALSEGIYRSSAIQKSNSMEYLSWTLMASNKDVPENINDNSEQVIPDYIWSSTPGTVLHGIPYAYGGFNELNSNNDSGMDSFLSLQTNGCLTGNVGHTYYPNNNADEIIFTAGLDCSGFVGAAYGMSSKPMSYDLVLLGTSIAKASIRYGDLIVKSNIHCLLFDHVDPANGNLWWVHDCTREFHNLGNQPIQKSSCRQIDSTDLSGFSYRTPWNPICSYVYTSLNTTQHQGVCSDCGYTMTEQHTYPLTSISSTQHQNKCKCGRTSGSASNHTFVYTPANSICHYITCAQNCDLSSAGDHVYTLTSISSTQHQNICVCGLTDGSAESHTFPSYYNYNGTMHYKISTGCGYQTSGAVHIYVNGVCRVCGYGGEAKSG